MRLKTFAQKVLNSRGDILLKQVIAKCSKNKAKLIEERTGIDLRGYTHVIDSYAVRHVMAKHSDPVTELKRGLVNVTLNDFNKIPEVLNSFDDVRNGGKSKAGNDVLIYAKRVNGHIIYIEEVRGKKLKEAILYTMYIKPKKA